eukprot:jgi/Galph1/3019/GphlegSOOS_G1697.1
METTQVDHDTRQPMETSKEPLFSIDEVVYVKSNSLLHEAKVKQMQHTVQNGMASFRYLVHYGGWNDSFDEWLEENDLYKHSTENQQQMINLREGAIVENLEDGQKEQNKTDQEVKNKKKRSSPDSENKEEKADIYSLFNIPGPLKRQLLDEWETITREKMSLTLPREYSVSRILEIWLATKNKQSESSKDDIGVEEFCKGLIEVFDASLGKILLYRYERQQYNRIFHENDTTQQPSEVYGAEHLLRLFVKLPTLLSQLQIPETGLLNIAQKSYELLRFLQKNSRKFFSSPQYEPLDKSPEHSNDREQEGEEEDNIHREE